MPGAAVRTVLEIGAPPARVWDVLADLGGYGGWNPVIREASGELRPGARLRLFFNPPGTRGTVFHPVLSIVEPARELRWAGRPGVPFVLESEHFFILEAAGEGRTRLVHDMAFTGLLAPLVVKLRGAMIRDSFEMMNRALKDRAEGCE